MRDDHNAQEESVTGVCLAAVEGESRVAGRGGGRRNKQKGRVMGTSRCVETRSEGKAVVSGLCAGIMRCDVKVITGEAIVVVCIVFKLRDRKERVECGEDKQTCPPPCWEYPLG